MTWRERISIDPSICHGQVCVKGTRVMVAVVLDNLATGVTTDALLKSYPSLTAEDVRACLEYAADLVRGRRLNPPPNVG